MTFNSWSCCLTLNGSEFWSYKCVPLWQGSHWALDYPEHRSPASVSHVLGLKVYTTIPGPDSKSLVYCHPTSQDSVCVVLAMLELAQWNGLAFSSDSPASQVLGLKVCSTTA